MCEEYKLPSMEELDRFIKLACSGAQSAGRESTLAQSVITDSYQEELEWSSQWQSKIRDAYSRALVRIAVLEQQLAYSRV